MKEYTIRFREEVGRVVEQEGESEQDAKFRLMEKFNPSLIHITHVEEKKC